MLQENGVGDIWNLVGIRCKRNILKRKESQIHFMRVLHYVYISCDSFLEDYIFRYFTIITLGMKEDVFSHLATDVSEFITEDILYHKGFLFVF